MITRHIADLLYHHECVIVPGLGGFIKAYSPAKIIHTTHQFYPPSGKIAFNSGLSANDGILANYIASVDNISYRQAISEIDHWVESNFETLKKGERIFLEGIGDLFMNASGRLEFNPSIKINFHEDSFGLPVFFAKAVEVEPLILSGIQPPENTLRRTKLHRLIPETIKWAAVLAPFVAFTLWGSLNGSIINNYVHNYTGMYSWVRSTPGKKVPVNIASFPVKVKERSLKIVQSPSVIMAGENISFNPGIVSYTELAKKNLIVDGKTTVITSKDVAADQSYYIIGGAFRDHSNALKLISMLEEKGYPASVVDTTPGGLYIVSMKRLDNYADAKSQLSEIKKAGFASSWILRKQSGRN
jgi:hypothetical protein